jgi:release factor glutamine methyltransferase
MDRQQFHQLQKTAEDKLRSAGIEVAATEVQIILETLLDVERVQVHLYGAELINDKIEKEFHRIVEKRCDRHPLQYILGEMYFYGRKFLVNPDVMVPTPETELLCELAIGYIRNDNLKAAEILDVGVGSGVISVTIACELPEVWLTAVDISQDAIGTARRNAALHEVGGRVNFIKSDIFSNLPQDTKYDLILSNPPYISEKEYAELSPEVLADPKISLLGGVDGLDIIRKLISDAPDYLKPKGRLLFEIGYNQAEIAAEISEMDKRYQSLAIIKDLNDVDRVVILRV